MNMQHSTRSLGLVWLGAFCLLALISAEHLLTAVAPTWDIAADMLLQNRIRDEGVLLTGHYSRWEFNHPGPFWFYYNHVIEWLLRPFELSRVQAWHWGSVLLNSVLLTGTVAGLTALLHPVRPVIFASTMTALLVAFVGPELAGIWMPERMIAPYAAFLVALAILSQGTIRILPVVTFLVSILVHGYVTMPILTLPFLAWGCWMAWRKQGGWLGVRPHAWPLVASFLIAACFIAPLVVDYVLHTPSNIHKILAAQASFEHHDLPGLGDILTFLHHLLLRDRTWQWAGMAVLLLLFWRDSIQALHRPVSRNIQLLLLAISVFMLAYYSRTPAPLFAFIAKFYLAIPPLALAVSLQHFGPKHWFSFIVVLFMLAPHLKLSPIDQGHKIQQATHQLIEDHTELPIRLDYIDHYQWPQVAGLLLELDRREVEACTTWQHMAFLYTDIQICDVDDRPTHRIVKGESCKLGCLYRSEVFDVEQFGLPALTPGTIILPNSSAVFFSDWQTPEAKFRWTRGTESHIEFTVTDVEFRGRLALIVDTLGEQPLALLLNDQVIADTKLDAHQLQLTFDFDPTLLLRNKTNTLSFKTPDARSPGSADKRILAIALHSLIIE